MTTLLQTASQPQHPQQKVDRSTGAVYNPAAPASQYKTVATLVSKEIDEELSREQGISIPARTQPVSYTGVLQLFVNFTAISLSKFYVAGVIELPFPRLRQSRDY